MTMAKFKYWLLATLEWLLPAIMAAVLIAFTLLFSFAHPEAATTVFLIGSLAIIGWFLFVSYPKMLLETHDDLVRKAKEHYQEQNARIHEMQADIKQLLEELHAAMRRFR